MITLVNTFKVYGENTDEFERIFSETAEFLSRQRGFRSYHLVRSNIERNTYFNIGSWATLSDFQTALALPQMREHHEQLSKIADTDPHPCTTVAAVSVDGSTDHLVHDGSR